MAALYKIDNLAKHTKLKRKYDILIEFSLVIHDYCSEMVVMPSGWSRRRSHRVDL